MENAGKADFDEATERKGLGTPATRASVIEHLISCGYVERKGRKLLATQDGMDLMAKLQITTGSMIGMDIFILNMEKKMRQSTSLVCAFLDILMSRLYPRSKRLTATIITGYGAAV